MPEPRLRPERDVVVLPRKARLGWCIAFLVLALVADAGCSRPRKPVEEVDWGQPNSNVARRTPLPERQAAQANGGGADRSANEATNGGSDSKPETSRGVGEAGSDSEGDPSAGASFTSDGGEAPGAGGKGPGGASNAPQQASPQRPAPALPGREPVKPTLTAAEAADSARKLLNRAQQLLRAADASAAAAAAIEAYDQVLPHAESDADCRKLRGQLEGVLTAAGRQQGRPEAVPTRFE